MVLFRKLHKWIGLAIGIQVAIWMLSGLAMGLIDHHKVTGLHDSAAAAALPISSLSGDLLEPHVIADRLTDSSPIRSMSLSSFSGRPVYRVTTADANTLYDAADGSLVMIDASLASAFANADYIGTGKILNVTEIVAPTLETRHHAGAVWRVDFDDQDETSYYISGQDGAILERRNSSWRLFDIFFMLHVMDYRGREDFNNVLVIIASLIAAWFAITGIVLFFGSFTANDFLRLIPGGAFVKDVELAVCAPHGEVVARIGATSGGRLYDELAKGGMPLPSSCGGGGTCGLCTVTLSPDAPVSAADVALIPEPQRQQGVRLSCQARAVDGLVVGVSEEVLAAERRVIEVLSARLVTPHIQEVTFAVVDGNLSYSAGSFVHIVIPPHKISCAESGLIDSIAEIWPGVWRAPRHRVKVETSRAYSLATATEDNPGRLVLNVRFMPPPDGTSGVPAGLGSSYMWNLRVGDRLKIIGPLGDFHACDSNREMIIIGGGAGMAPLRSIIRSELLHKNSSRRIQFWYGARSKQDLFYVEEFDELQKNFSNFSWQAVLSDAGRSDNWQGATGFVHLTVRDQHLRHAQDPALFEYYVCGPPLMLAATRAMLADFGVPENQVLFDDFGI